jgi:hypothetical protein
MFDRGGFHGVRDSGGSVDDFGYNPLNKLEGCNLSAVYQIALGLTR